MEPVADNRYGFVGVLVGEFADFLHGLGMNLALDLGDIDHRGSAVGNCDSFIAADDRDVRASRQVILPLTPGSIIPAAAAASAVTAGTVAAGAAANGVCAPSGVMTRRTSGRTTMNITTRPSSAITPFSAAPMMSSLVNCR